jgi:predicted Zn-dependent protease
MKRDPKARVAAALLTCLLLSGLPFGCASLNRGTENWVILPTAMEVSVGQQVTSNVIEEYPLNQHTGVNMYVQRLGANIVSICDRRDLVYHFTVLNSPKINAFAAPGGFIFVTTGMLASLSNEAELVVVLGHETGHVVAKHGAQRIQTQLGLGLAADLAGLSKKSELFQSMVGLGTQLAVQGYSRQNELEADHYGALYASRLGYDPAAALSVFKKLKAMESKSPALMADWMASHPPADVRIREYERTRNELPSLKGILNQAAYARGISPIQHKP